MAPKQKPSSPRKNFGARAKKVSTRGKKVTARSKKPGATRKVAITRAKKASTKDTHLVYIILLADEDDLGGALTPGYKFDHVREGGALWRGGIENGDELRNIRLASAMVKVKVSTIQTAMRDISTGAVVAFRTNRKEEDFRKEARLRNLQVARYMAVRKHCYAPSGEAYNYDYRVHKKWIDNNPMHHVPPIQVLVQGTFALTRAPGIQFSALPILENGKANTEVPRVLPLSAGPSPGGPVASSSAGRPHYGSKSADGSRSASAAVPKQKVQTQPSATRIRSPQQTPSSGYVSAGPAAVKKQRHVQASATPTSQPQPIPGSGDSVAGSSVSTSPNKKKRQVQPSTEPKSQPQQAQGSSGSSLATTTAGPSTTHPKQAPSSGGSATGSSVSIATAGPSQPRTAQSPTMHYSPKSASGSLLPQAATKLGTEVARTVVGAPVRLALASYPVQFSDTSSGADNGMEVDGDGDTDIDKEQQGDGTASADTHAQSPPQAQKLSPYPTNCVIEDETGGYSLRVGRPGAKNSVIYEISGRHMRQILQNNWVSNDVVDFICAYEVAYLPLRLARLYGTLQQPSRVRFKQFEEKQVILLPAVHNHHFFLVVIWQLSSDQPLYMILLDSMNKPSKKHSCRGVNEASKSATRFFRELEEAARSQLSSRAVEKIIVRVQHQENSNDCGLHVWRNLKHVVRILEAVPPEDFVGHMKAWSLFSDNTTIRTLLYERITGIPKIGDIHVPTFGLCMFLDSDGGEHQWPARLLPWHEARGVPEVRDILASSGVTEENHIAVQWIGNSLNEDKYHVTDSCDFAQADLSMDISGKDPKFQRAWGIMAENAVLKHTPVVPPVYDDDEVEVLD